MALRGHHEVVLLLGAPGAGKGTQARMLAESLGVPHVASGDLLREHRARGTELGRAAQIYMDRGDLVPDDLVVAMIMERLEQPDALGGVLLDGFPRTLAQAEALDAKLREHGGQVRVAINLDVPKEALVRRLEGRRICRSCQATYHVDFNPSPAGESCGVCGGALYQRPDDRREVVANRVGVYLRDTVPVIEHYRHAGVLHRIDGDRDIEVIRSELAAAAGLKVSVAAA